MEIRRIAPSEHEAVVDASPLFDSPVVAPTARRFLNAEGHVLFVAFADGTPVGFVSGVEMTHPDKGTEMFLYELAVADDSRREGIGSALVAVLRDFARERGCYDMWVLTDADNSAALATYAASGAGQPSAHVMLTWELGG